MFFSCQESNREFESRGKRADSSPSASEYLCKISLLQRSRAGANEIP